MTHDDFMAAANEWLDLAPAPLAALLAKTYAAGEAAGVAKERAAVVKWLQRQEAYANGHAAITTRRLVDAIESGDHAPEPARGGGECPCTCHREKKGGPYVRVEHCVECYPGAR